MTNQYVLNPLTINPAYAGNRGVMNIAGFLQEAMGWVQGAPETMTFAADAPVLDNKVGLGLIVISDKVGVTKETYFISNYSYTIDAW